jgi:hypothetical protein
LTITAFTVSYDAVTTLNEVLIAVTIALGAAALLVLPLQFLRNPLRERRQIRNLLSVPPNPSNLAIRLSAARAAFERAEYRRVCVLLTNRDGTPCDERSTSGQLLLAAACSELGGYERSAMAFRSAITTLATPHDTTLQTTKLLPSERLILTGLVQQFPDVMLETGLELPLASATEHPETQMNSLVSLRQSVNKQGREAERRKRQNFATNLVLGGLAAAAAAGAGVSGVSGRGKVLIGVLALVSAATSTILITLKPAETAEVARKTAEALSDLSSEIDLFETEGTHEPDAIRQAKIEVLNRLSAAKNRPRLVPLIPSAVVQGSDATRDAATR